MDTRHTSGIRHRFWLLGTLAIGLAAACSSSNNAADAGSSSGKNNGATSGNGNGNGGGNGFAFPDAAIGTITATCGALETFTGVASTGTCPSGQTCCSTVSFATLSASASCVAVGDCTNGISNQCNSTADCTDSNVCCSGEAADAGSGIAGLLPGIGALVAQLNTACQPSCTAGQTQHCTSDPECPTGESCTSLLAILPYDAGALDAYGIFDAGAIPKICLKPRGSAGGPPATPEAGPAPELDAGTSGDW